MSGDTVNKLRAKVTRADQHIQDFQLGLHAFFDTQPYGVAIEQNPQGGNAAYYVSRIESPPDTLAAIAADVVSNLRSALDNLAYQLVLDARGGTKPDWKVYFPISKSAAQYKGTRCGCIKGVRQEVIDAIDATEPYKCGKGHALWQLQQLSNSDKHEILLESFAYSRSVDVSVDIEHSFRQIPGFERVKVPPLFLNPAKKLLPLKVADVLFLGPAQPEVAENRQFRFDISIRAPGVIEPEPAIKTLKDLSNLVGGILRKFEPFFA